MTQNQTITKIADKFSINTIYAHRLFHTANREHMYEDIAKLLKEKPKPFVKWVGGKRQLLTQFRLMNLYPPEKFDIKNGRYFEPFVGGGAVFFDLLPETAFLSDLNNELVVTYNVIKNDVENLIKSLKKHKLDKEYFLKVRSQKPEKLSDINIASRFIYCWNVYSCLFF